MRNLENVPMLVLDLGVLWEMHVPCLQTKGMGSAGLSAKSFRSELILEETGFKFKVIKYSTLPRCIKVQVISIEMKSNRLHFNLKPWDQESFRLARARWVLYTQLHLSGCCYF